MIPLTYTHCPRCNDPTGDTKDQQDSPRADGHQSLHHKTSVEINLIEGPDAAWGGICEQLAVQQHDTSDQVQTQEHRDRKNDVYIGICYRCCVIEGQAGSPGEHILAWDWMDGTDEELQHNEEDPLKGHCYPPVICPIVNHEQLLQMNKINKK